MARRTSSARSSARVSTRDLPLMARSEAAAAYLRRIGCLGRRPRGAGFEVLASRRLHGASLAAPLRPTRVRAAERLPPSRAWPAEPSGSCRGRPAEPSLAPRAEPGPRAGLFDSAAMIRAVADRSRLGRVAVAIGWPLSRGSRRRRARSRGSPRGRTLAERAFGGLREREAAARAGVREVGRRGTPAAARIIAWQSTAPDADCRRPSAAATPRPLRPRPPPRHPRHVRPGPDRDRASRAPRRRRPRAGGRGRHTR